MKKLLLTLIVCSNVLLADYLYQPTSVCVKSYYFKNGYIYYTLSDTGATVTSSTKNLGDDVFEGYDYNATSNECKKTPSNNTLGMKNEDFNYLNAVLGLIVFVLLTWSLLA